MRLNQWLPIFIIAVVAGYSSVGLAKDAEILDVAVYKLALAPNAGGQEAYRIEAHQNHHAFYGFNNRDLMIGKNTMYGLGYGYRLPICGDDCFWRLFTQVGGGLTNGGGFAEITWGIVIPLIPIWLPISAPRYIPSIRLDVSTHFFATTSRVLTWSYPLWLGLSVSF